MGLFDWLFRRGRPQREAAPSGQDAGPAQPADRSVPSPRPDPCPHCGARMRQSRADGRCVACGADLPEALRSAQETTEKGDGSGGRRRFKQPRPADVQRIGAMVTFANGNFQMMMDVDAFEYVYGDADGPDPAQRDLDDLLPRVTRVCVLEGAMLQGRAMGGPVLFDTRDAGAIQELANCLKIVEDPTTFGHCQCLGGPTLELYAGHEHVATISLQHGQAIRWNHWYHDARLQDGDRLNRWLHQHGVAPDRLENIYHRGDNFLFQDPESAGGPRQEAQRLCEQAAERARAGNLDEALHLATRAIDADPGQAEAYSLRAQIHYHARRLPEAAADCSAAIDLGFRLAEVYFIRAIARHEDGRPEEALADCSMALHLEPNHAAAHNSRGLIRTHLGQHSEALADFAEAIRLQPTWCLPFLNRARLAHGQGQLASAMEDYDRAVELVKDSRPNQATGELDPMAAMIYCHRGDAHYDQFHEEQAESDFAEASRRHPEAAARFLGETWLRRNQPERALWAFTELVQLCPQDPQGYFGRGLAQERLGNLEDAAAEYTAAIRLDSTGTVGYLYRARVRHQQGRDDEAIADLAEHLRLHPNDATGYLIRSGLRKEQKALAAALEDLNTAQRLAPDDPQVCNCLAWMLATCADERFRDGPRAVALARQACQATEWKHPYCLGTLGAALAEAGDFEEAIRWQTEALASYPESELAAGQERLDLYRAGQPYRE